MWIVNIALRRPYTFLVMALLILLSMPYVLRKMSVDIFPSIDIPVVAMLYSYNGLPAPEIYSRITRTAERAMTQSVDNIEHTESISLAGGAIIKVFFQQGTDIGTALAQVQSGANAAYRSLPVGIAPPQVVQYSATDLPLLQVGVSSATVPETEVGELANDVVRNTLRLKKGVELTAPFGARNRQISVDIDTAALLARGITPADVTQAIGNQTLTLPTGIIKIGDREYDVALNGSVATIAKIGDIPISTVNGKTIHVRDVASVRDGAGPLTTIVRQNGERGILTSVFKVGGVSTLEVVEQVRKEGAMTLAPHCAAQHYHDAYGLVRLDMDEDPIWAWENIVYKNYETLKPAARALARSSAVYADELVKKDTSGWIIRPNGTA